MTDDVTEAIDGKVDFTQTLESHHLEIVRSLDLDRQYILSHLRSKFVLDDEDCQLIRSGTTRQQQASKFIDVLLTKGPQGFFYFLEALEIEHPHLYESITGIQAETRNGLENFSPWEGVANEQDWLNFDNRYLLQELHKMSESNRATLQMHERFTHERSLMQIKLKEFKSELNDRDEVIQDLTSTIESRRGEEDSINQTLLTDVEANGRKVDELFRENFDKSCHIIKLQSQLLAIKESYEKLRKSKETVSRKNEQLISQVRDLTINYDFQRSKTQRLSWQVDANKRKLENVADTKKELLAVKFELSRLKEEKESVSDKLETLERKNFELESECNMLHRDKSNVEVEKSKASMGLLKFEAMIKKLEANLEESVRTVDTYKRRNGRLVEEMEILKEQRDFYINEREGALKERNRIASELTNCSLLNQELQKSRDEAIQKQIKMVAYVEQKNSALSNEIDRLNEECSEMKMKELLKKCRETNSSSLKNSEKPSTKRIDTTKGVVEKEQNAQEFKQIEQNNDILSLKKRTMCNSEKLITNASTLSANNRQIKSKKDFKNIKSIDPQQSPISEQTFPIARNHTEISQLHFLRQEGKAMVHHSIFPKVHDGNTINGNGQSPTTEQINGQSPTTEQINGQSPTAEQVNSQSPTTEQINGQSPTTEQITNNKTNEKKGQSAISKEEHQREKTICPDNNSEQEEEKGIGDNHLMFPIRTRLNAMKSRSRPPLVKVSFQSLDLERSRRCSSENE